MPQERPTSQGRETQELLTLMWFFWGGILMATVGELMLIFLSGDGAQPGPVTLSNATIFICVVVLGIWVSIWRIYTRRMGGGGMPTAIFCWMLAKGSAVLGLVTFFLEPSRLFTAVILVGFLLIMGVLQPTGFLAEKPA